MQTGDVHEVLVFRALQLGDMLCAVPALRALRAGLPRARIVLVGLPWAIQFAHRFDTLVDEFIAFPGHPLLPEPASDPEGWPALRLRLRARRAGLAIQLHGSGEASNAIVREFGAQQMAGFARAPSVDSAGFHPYPEHGHESERLLALMRALGLNTGDRRLAFPLRATDDDELRAAGMPAALGGRAYACMHAGARDPARRWPAAAFAEVGDYLSAAFGLQVVLTGSAAEHELAQQVARQMRHRALNAALPLSIGAMAALMDRARLLVCNDTGASHLAAALRLPSVVVFRKDARARWAPQDHRRHRCVLDVDATRVRQVMAAARRLLQDAALCRSPPARDSGSDRCTS